MEREHVPARTPSPRAGSGSGAQGWAGVLCLASAAAGPSPASQDWDQGGKSHTKEVGGALREALLS